MEAFEAYKIYHALKLHFTSDYDYTKYHGKAKVTVDSYLKRKDRPFFAKVARKYMTPDNTKNFFGVINFSSTSSILPHIGLLIEKDILYLLSLLVKGVTICINHTGNSKSNDSLGFTVTSPP